jgi:hypothetical protein
MTISSPNIFVTPATAVITTLETWPWGFDATNLLAEGDSITSPVSVMVDTNTGAAVTLSDSPTIDGNVITQIVRGSELTAGHSYRLTVTFTASANTVPAMPLLVNVPF